MSSFYGGRPGNSFSIVATFGSVNAMVTQFKKGPNYVAVHYDEHVSISSSDSDNGNVYRRGYNYTDSMGGAELVGNLLKGSSGGANAELVDIRIGYDGTTYKSAGEAVRGQVNILKDEFDEQFIVGKNVFNPDDVLLDYTIDTTTGELYTSTGSMTSGKIWTHGAAKVIISYLSSNGTQALQAFQVFRYEADDTFILPDVTASSVELPPNCAYIRFVTSPTFATKRKNIMVELTEGNVTDFSAYEPYKVRLNPKLSIKENVEKEMERFEKLSEQFIVGKNVFNPDDVLLDYTIDTTTGELYTSTGSMTSGKIWTHGAAKVIISYLSSNGTQALQAFSVFQYKADDTFIPAATTVGSVVTLNSECDYIRFVTSSTFAALRTRLMLEFADSSASTFTAFENYKIKLNPEISIVENLSDELNQINEFKGKLIVGKNKFNPDTVLIPYTINTTTGIITNSANGSMTSDKIKTNGAAKAIISYLASNSGTQALQAFCVCQYRADDTFISAATTVDSVVTLNSECDYIRFFASAAFVAKRRNIMVELTDTTATTYSYFERYRTKFSPNVVTALPITSITSRVILSTETVNIKLIGDSITHGKGSSDFKDTGSTFVTTSSGTELKRNTGSKSWAALLEKRLETDYHADVTNNAFRGWRTSEILGYWDQIIDGNEDIVICMIGTNNRSVSNGKQLFYRDLQTIKDNLEANGTEVIFMSANPVSASNEGQKNAEGEPALYFHMNDVDDVICKFAADNNREYISLYKKTLDYMDYTGATIGELLDDGIHPNDRLHLLFYKWISDALGLSRKIDGATW